MSDTDGAQGGALSLGITRRLLRGHRLRFPQQHDRGEDDPHRRGSWRSRLGPIHRPRLILPLDASGRGRSDR
ncbi:hypothetical protein [Mycobacterium ostraviense]|uniref:hypothetical protein n=1 Tax=Mycobacterium ostraviense TaxID=2738409 RepID=UPI00128FE7F6|nr:hypothetical protein [Mycobacterium ostraviense]